MPSAPIISSVPYGCSISVKKKRHGWAQWQGGTKPVKTLGHNTRRQRLLSSISSTSGISPYRHFCDKSAWLIAGRGHRCFTWLLLVCCKLASILTHLIWKQRISTLQWLPSFHSPWDHNGALWWQRSEHALGNNAGVFVSKITKESW